VGPCNLASAAVDRYDGVPLRLHFFPACLVCFVAMWTSALERKRDAALAARSSLTTTTTNSLVVVGVSRNT